MSVGAVLLAGGLARRMGGQDKGLVLLHGRPMIAHVLDTVRPLVDRCVINANRNIDSYRQMGVDVVSDELDGYQGPLAGLSAGLTALGTSHVFMAPCDSPFLQAGLFHDMLNACCDADADVAVPDDGERLQPAFLVVNSRVRSSLREFLATGERKIDRWFAELHTVKVPARCYVRSFRNINTEEELLEAERDRHS